MKGRKPDSKAVRRNPKPSPQTELIAEPSAMPPALQKPDAVLANPTMSQCWDLVVGDGYQYSAADIPQLEMLCYSYAVYRQCMNNTLTPDGRVITKIGRITDEGTVDPATAKAHPDIKTAREAMATYRTLADELGVSPLARQKMGLLEAVTHSTQADLVRKTEELFTRFKGRLSAPN